MSQSGYSNTSPAATHPDESQNPAQHATETAKPTEVWFVQGKKANKNFRSALAIHRENATLTETDGKKDDPQHRITKET